MIGINAMAMGTGSGGLGELGTKAVEGACSLVEKGCNACSNLISVLSGFDIMNEVSKEALTFNSIATTIAMLLLTIELCSQAMGFHFEDINEGFRFVFKIVVYKIIIENSSNIVKIVYGLFFRAEGWSNLAKNFIDIGKDFTDIGSTIVSKMSGDEGILGVGKLISGLVIAVVAVFVFITLIKIVISLAGIIFEIGIDIVVAPVPIATLVCHETRSIGVNFIKGFAANCMTVMMYGVCFTVYNGIAGSITTAFSSSALGVTDGFFAGAVILVPHLISLLLLSVATKNASNMMSKILG